MSFRLTRRISQGKLFSSAVTAVISGISSTTYSEYGAEFALFYNPTEGFVKPRTQTLSPAIGIIEEKAAKVITDTIRAGGRVNVTFDAAYSFDHRVGADYMAGGVPSFFTSWGGLYDLKIKPDVAAPGSNILSVRYSAGGGGYMVASGTSMATPYVAGVAALYVSKYGGRSVHGPGIAKTVMQRIIASGASLPWSVDTFDGYPPDFGFNAPVPQVGSGQVNAWKVLNYSTSMSFEKFVLSDTRHFERYHTVEITNTLDTPVEYSFSLEPAGGFEAQGPRESELAYNYELTPVSIVPEVSFPSGRKVLKGGETKKFK